MCYCGEPIGVRGDHWVHLIDQRWRCYPEEREHAEFVAQPDPFYEMDLGDFQRPRRHLVESEQPTGGASDAG